MFCECTDDNMMIDLKSANIKNIKLPVSAPFHCKLMNKATLVMNEEIKKLNFKESKNILISNVTGKEINNLNELKDLLVQQIESRVRWRESVLWFRRAQGMGMDALAMTRVGLVGDDQLRVSLHDLPKP